MSKRNHIIERASDVNGGQYIQTNPSYNSGYEDGKKAGKEYCASEIKALREQVEKLTEAYDQCGRTVQDYGRTIDQTESRLREVATHCANVEQQLAASPTPPVSEDKDKIIAAANALENIASTSSSTRIRRVANEALTAIRARRN